MPSVDIKNYASSIQEAQTRFKEFELADPFPSITPSLLNSADIADYIRATGMIYPYDAKNLKPATLALTIGGPYIYWDAKGNRKEGVLSKGRTIILEKDSILFLTIEQYIQLPQYIAARFNLKIDNVYRGLLLGTGPMVDPGFRGYLSIPLHNFTSNEYHLRGGDTIIWMEFTKVSTNVAWHRTREYGDRTSKFVPFNAENRDKPLAGYISDADSRPIQSSIPLSVIRSERAAKKAQQQAKALAFINVALLIAVITFIWNVYSQTNTFYSTVKKDEKEYESTLVFADSLKVRAMQVEIDSLNARILRLTK